MNAASGLGGNSPWSARREKAAASIIPDKATDDDEDEPEPLSTVASTVASKSVEQGEVLPPPSRDPVGRVQLNARILVDRMKALKKYQHRHGATMQAVVDQMVDEYLSRRDLI